MKRRGGPRAPNEPETSGESGIRQEEPLPDAEPWLLSPGQWRLLAPAAIAWACAAVTIASPGTARAVLVVAASSGAALLVAAVRGAAWARVALRFTAVLLAVLVVLAARIFADEAARADPVLLAAAAESRTTEQVVTLRGYPRAVDSEYGDRSWVHATAESALGSVPVLLFLDEPVAAGWAPGVALRVRGVPSTLEPGGLAAFSMRVLERSEMLPPAGGWIAVVSEWAGSRAAEIRSGLREAAARVPGAELVPGFAVGDTSLVPESLDEQMLATSLTHLTAVSGANCALVTGAMIWVLAHLGVGRRMRIAVAALALAGFVFLVGPDASVQRAAVMAAVLLASGFGGKRSAALPALGAAMLVLLFMNPWQALQPGFALSVSATAGILLMAGPVSDWLSRRGRLPKPLAVALAVSLAAQLACGPLLLLLQPGIPAVGVLANVLAAPAAPLGTGLGLLAAVFLPFWPWLGGMLLVGASFPARWVVATAGVASSIPAGRWAWPDGWLGAVLLTVCELLLLLALWVHRGRLPLPGGSGGSRRVPWRSREPRPRPIAAVVAVLSSAALGLFVSVAFVAPLVVGTGVPRAWSVVACDVGQGDALLLRSPERGDEVMLVDTGDDPEMLTSCLERFGVSRIALLVLSHDDRDHVGALDAIVHRVDRALLAPATSAQAEGARAGGSRPVVRMLESAGVPYEIGAAGGAGALHADSAMRWKVLAPEQGAVPADTNAASLVMNVTLGQSRVLLLGDTGYDQQRALVDAGVDLSAEVVKVAHHGSRDQDHRLPAKVGAGVALVSVGAGNGYGHPAADTLGALSRVGTRVLRTDFYGSIALTPVATGFEVWIERSPGDMGDAGDRDADANAFVAPTVDALRATRWRSLRKPQPELVSVRVRGAP